MQASTPIAAMVAKMLAAGVPHEAIVLAVETAERVSLSGGIQVENSGGIQVESTAEKRRKWDREYRRNKKLSGGIQVESGGNPPESEVSAIYLKEEDLKKEKKVAAGRKIPPDWKPSEIHFTEGSRLGFDRPKVEAFAHDMRLWAEANGNRAVARKADWDKTFLGWLRRQKPGEAPPPSTQPAEPKGRDPPELPPDKRHFYRWFSSKTPEGLPPEQWQAFAEGMINGAEIS